MAPAIAEELHLSAGTVRTWLKRFNVHGLPGLQDATRSGRPTRYTAEQVGEVVAAALTTPQSLGLPFASWTLDRLEAYLNETKGIAIKRTRIDDILLAEGLRWRKQETCFGERLDWAGRSRVAPEFVEKGVITALYQELPASSVVINLDEMGPEAAKSHPGQQLVHQADGQRPAERARQEADYGRRGKGYVFGAFRPTSGVVLVPQVA